MNSVSTSIDTSRGPWSRRLFYVGIGLVCTTLVALFVLHQPGSPLQLIRADQFLVQGDVDRALALYQNESKMGWTQSHRRFAHERVASIFSVEKDKEQSAAQEWETLANQSGTDARERARYWTNAATHYVIDGTAPDRAAEAFLQAAQSTGTDAESASLAWMAGQQWLRSGSPERAEKIWIDVSSAGPVYRSKALLSLGKLNLGLGHTEEALSWFEDAVNSAKTDAQRVNAKMGVQISLERLGNLDEAIAELNETGLSEALRDVRAQKMLERSEKLQME